jgi:hypothetical protein
VLPRIAIYLDDESLLYLKAGLALEQSISLRFREDHDGSERTIHDFCCLCESPTSECLPRVFMIQSLKITGRARAVYGLIHRLHLENLVQREAYDLAEKRIANWPNPESKLEWATFPSRTLTSSKIYRSHGSSSSVQDTLEASRYGSPDNLPADNLPTPRRLF